MFGAYLAVNTLDVILFGEIPLNRPGLAAGRDYLCYNRFRVPPTRRVVDDDSRAGERQFLRYPSADPFRSAGHKRNLIREGAHERFTREARVQ